MINFSPTLQQIHVQTDPLTVSKLNCWQRSEKLTCWYCRQVLTYLSVPPQVNGFRRRRCSHFINRQVFKCHRSTLCPLSLQARTVVFQKVWIWILRGNHRDFNDYNIYASSISLPLTNMNFRSCPLVFNTRKYSSLLTGSVLNRMALKLMLTCCHHEKETNSLGSSWQPTFVAWTISLQLKNGWF